jgi:tetratricopeptide (TPR) repeat protein
MWQLFYTIFLSFSLSLSAQQADDEWKLAQTCSEKDKAIIHYKKALKADPNHFNSHIALAKIYYESNQSDLAILHYTHAAKFKNDDARIYYNIGQAYSQKEALSEALEYYLQAIAIDPNHIQARIHVGAIQEKFGKHQDAITTYQNMIAHDPTCFEGYYRLGNLYKNLENLEAALEQYRKAFSLQPQNIYVIMELANTLNMLDYCKEALVFYRTLLEIDRTVISALYNFGYTLKKMGDLDNALMVYNEVLAKKPDYVPALFSRSTIFLAKGDYERGFQEYEWRWKAYNEQPEKYNRPLWEGEDLTNKTLLVYAEQGLGDTLQFVRYLKYIKTHVNQSVHLIFETQDPLYDLLKIQPYIDEILPRSKKPTQCHYHIPLMTLARVLKTRLDTIQSDFPYIHADPILVEQWRKKLNSDTNLKVGICWQGNSGYQTLPLRKAVAAKSIPLKLFEQICNIPGVSLYSLQQVTGVDQIADCPFADKIKHFDDTFDKKNGRFMDTAAVMMAMDVIISVDTATCHLAGALRVPTWILLPNPADWRWLLNRTDSAWYPSVRLFKQPKMGDWQSVINNVARALRELVFKKKHPETEKIIMQEILKTDSALRKKLTIELTHLD